MVYLTLPLILLNTWFSGLVWFAVVEVIETPTPPLVVFSITVWFAWNLVYAIWALFGRPKKPAEAPKDTPP